jgi:hypothetical protein
MSHVKLIVAVFVLSVAAAGAQTLPDIQPPPFDPAQQQTMIPPAAAEDGTCVCTMEYNPMCGRTGDGVRKTFSNECLAMCENAEIVGLGPC